MDDESKPVFVFEEPVKRVVSRLSDVHTGERFRLRGKVFTKRNHYGWVYGVCNAEEEDGRLCHIHPTTEVSLFEDSEGSA